MNRNAEPFDACSSPLRFLQTETVCPQVLPGKALHDMVMHKSLVSLDSREATIRSVLTQRVIAEIVGPCARLELLIYVPFLYILLPFTPSSRLCTYRRFLLMCFLS